jgi:hypothetical protein
MVFFHVDFLPDRLPVIRLVIVVALVVEEGIGYSDLRLSKGLQS